MKKLNYQFCQSFFSQTTKLFLTFLFICLPFFLKAQTVSITTDQDDYYPGEWVIISGTGWVSGDSVKLSITHIGDSIPNHTHTPWTLIADSNGNLSDEWYVAEMELNTTLWLQAQSLSTPSIYAEKVFTDATSLVISGTVKLANGTPIPGVTVTDYKDSGLTIVEYTSLTRSPDGVWSFTLPKDVTRYVVVTPPTGYTCSNVIFGYAPNGTILSKVSNNEIKVIGGANGGFSTGNQFILVLNNSIPTISTISPIVKCEGDAAFTLSVNGTNFNSNSVVNFNGSPRSTTFINSGLLYASITASDIEKAVITSITVSNQIPGGGTSNGATLVVNNLPSAPSSVNNSFIYDGNTHFIAAKVNTGEDIYWFDAPTGGNLISEVPFLKNVGSITAYAESRNTTTGCASTTRTSITLTVTARPIVITADAKDKTYGDTDPALTAQVTSGSIIGSDEASGSLTRAQGENVGSYLISRATYTYGSNYIETFVGANLIIGQRPITITADAQSKTYGDIDPSLTSKVTTGLIIGSDAASGSMSRAEGENVGSYLISKATYTYGSNYDETFVDNNLVIEQRPITITADAQNKTYGDTDPSLTAQVTFGSIIGSDAASGSLTRAQGENVGAYLISKATYTYGSNYDETFVDNNLVIEQRPITITADAQNKTYGEDDPALTAKVTTGSIVSRDVASGLMTRATGENVGSYLISKATYTYGNNYDETFVDNNLVIEQRPITITADAQNKTYGDTDPSLTAQVTFGSIVGSDAASGSLTRAQGENVGSYLISKATYTYGNNYDETFVDNNFVIGQRPITITADAQNKTYGDTDPSLTAQVTFGSIVGSDAASGSLTRAEGENVGSYLISKATYTYGSNYDETFKEANLVIEQRPITITADAQNKTYGDADPSLTAQVTSGSIVTGDAAFGSMSRAQGENVGSYLISKATYTYGSNYDETFKEVNLVIEQRPITITADAQNKTYGDADPSLTAQVSLGTIIGSDAASGSLTRAEGENVGSYLISKATYTYGSNYDETFKEANLIIGQRPITITADAQNKTYGDADPSLTSKVTTGLIIGSDAASGSMSRAEGENVGSYLISKATYTYGSNYDETFKEANLVIGQRPITITADAASKYCGQEDPILNYKITSGDLVNGDIFSGLLIRETGDCSGTYNIMQNTVSLSRNYLLKYEGAKLTIIGVSVDASASSTPVQLGAPAPVLQAQISPAVANVSIDFNIENGNGEITTYSAKTDGSGLAKVSGTGLTSVDVYKVTALIGNCHTSTAAYLAVYDPNGGFVTGGGWIDSPKGAYKSDPNLTGKANFGFNSKYQKGKNIPDGNTEFQFQTAKLNFSSSSYTIGSLIISGAKATYKGAGTINGSGNYAFLVTVIDGNITGCGDNDKFRIKIWNGNSVIYDNNVGSAGLDDNDLPVTALGGGSIVIHNDKTKSAEIQQVQPVGEQNVASCNIIVPNGFSPNGDGLNDYFRVSCLQDYADASLKIYSPEGRLVYEQQHYGNLDFWGSDDAAWWHGRIRSNTSGITLPSGSYIYILELNPTKKEMIKTGVVFISR